MKRVRPVSRAVLAAVLSLCIWLPASEGRAAGAWEWTLVPYLWATDIGMEVKISDETILDTDVAFGDLLDKVDLAFSAHFEGRRGKGGFLLDLTYISLSNEMTLSSSSGVPPQLDGAVIDTEVDLAIVEAGGFYRPGGEKTGLDVLFGIRYIGIDQKFDITPALPPPLDSPILIESSPSLTDGFVGLRYSGTLGKKWGYAIRGDIGAGGTELTLNGIAGMSYQIGKSGRYGLRFGYRYMDMEIDEEKDGTRVETDMTMSGIYAGIAFQW